MRPGLPGEHPFSGHLREASGGRPWQGASRRAARGGGVRPAGVLGPPPLRAERARSPAASRSSHPRDGGSLLGSGFPARLPCLQTCAQLPTRKTNEPKLPPRRITLFTSPFPATLLRRLRCARNATRRCSRRELSRARAKPPQIRSLLALAYQSSLETRSVSTKEPGLSQPRWERSGGPGSAARGCSAVGMRGGRQPQPPPLGRPLVPPCLSPTPSLNASPVAPRESYSF